MLLDSLDANIECTGVSSIADSLDQRGNFDLILLDYGLPDSNGTSGLKQICERYKGVPVVILSGEGGSDIVHEVVSSGASGFIPKSFDGKKMLGALELIMKGGIFLPAYAIEEGPSRTKMTAEEIGLSNRQVDCLLRLVHGKQNKVIAKEMGLSDNTIKAHLSGAFKILGVSSRSEAVFKIASLELFPAIGIKSS